MIEVVGEKELPRILDFGIATAVIADTERENSLEGGRKDKKGVVGSPYYMPPEQFQGVEMGFYTDLYSLGVIIYECLTGQKPYTGKTPKEVYKKIKQGAPVPVRRGGSSSGRRGRLSLTPGGRECSMGDSSSRASSDAGCETSRSSPDGVLEVE